MASYSMRTSCAGRCRCAASLLSVLLCLLALSLAGGICEAAEDEATRLLLAAGDKALGNGRAHYQEALSKYTEALVRSPASERGLFSRAQLLSMTSERKAALADLDSLLAVSPDHPQALALRMNLNAQEGHLDRAAADGKRLTAVYAAAGKATKAKETKETVRKLEMYAAAWHRISDVMDVPLSQHLAAAPGSARRRHYEECVNLLQAVIHEYGVDSVDLRLRRASCALAADNNQVALQEVKLVLTKDPQNLVATALNAKALRGLGALDQAKSEVRRCLSLDPEYTLCANVNKLIRSQVRHVASIERGLQGRKFENALREIQEAFDEESGAPPYAEKLLQWRCDAYVALRDTVKGVPACEAALAMTGPDSRTAADIRIQIAELYIVDDDLDRAEAVAKKAKESISGYGKIEEVLAKIQKLRRTQSRKDYYKILGIKKSASQQEIRRAYRKLAKEHHPDRWRSLDISDREREKNDQRFREINEAKEVLSDESMRARYDSGEDVMNPQAQPNQGGPFYAHPFHFPQGFPRPGGPGGPRGPGGGGGQWTFFHM